MQGFDDDARDLVSSLLEEPLQEFDIIERGDQNAAANGIGDPGTVGDGVRVIRRAGGGQAHLGFGRHPVIAAFEFQYQVAPGVCTRQAHREHVGLASRRHEPDLFRACNSTADLLRQLDCPCIVGKEGHSERKLLKNGFMNFRMTVAENHGPGSDQQVDEFEPVFRPDTRTGTFANENPRVEVPETAGRQGCLRPFNPLAATVNPDRHQPVPQSS